MQFPNIDPIALQIGPLAIRWYALAYIAGILLGWYYIRALNRRRPISGLSDKALDDMILYAVLGVIGGGRLGYVLFYKPGYYLAHPLHALTLWEGGMSFHGGLLGVLIAFWLFCRRYKIRYLELMDVLAPATPIGLFFGRLANFINGELYGRITGSPLGMVFPQGGPLPRHPSQLYEAGMEGIVLFSILFVLAWCTRARERIGLMGGVFMAGYALCRMSMEQFREPDAHLGFIFGPLTMGQLLSAPMLAIGLFLIIRGLRRVPAPAA